MELEGQISLVRSKLLIFLLFQDAIFSAMMKLRIQLNQEVLFLPVMLFKRLVQLPHAFSHDWIIVRLTLCHTFPGGFPVFHVVLLAAVWDRMCLPPLLQECHHPASAMSTSN